MVSMTEIEFIGTGGQGSVVAGKLLADAAVKAGHNSQAFASYGALRRGGEVESYVRLSKRPIRSHSKIYGADYTIIMSENMIGDVLKKGKLKRGATVLVNTPKDKGAFPLLKDFKVVVLDANRIAIERGLALPSGIPIINTTILGALCRLLPSMEVEHLAEAFREAKLPAVGSNIEAAREAYTSLLQHLEPAVAKKEEVSGRVAEALLPEYCPKLSPCEADCPAGEHIRKTAYFLQRGHFEEALANIREENPLPGVCGRVCFHPCQENCNRIDYDEEVAANALERAAWDYADPAKTIGLTRRPATGKSVAIIGSGPAGLTSAYFLALLGHSPTVLESQSVAGGIPRLGIPAYRLPKDIIDRELEDIRAAGVEVRLNTEVGKEISFASLIDGYDACLVAAGAHRSVALNIPGENSSPVVSGLSLLKQVALGERVAVGSSVLVIGGGNTAVDAARTARRLGAVDVTILYRRTAKEMPAHAGEVTAARNEGIKFSFLTIPIEVQAAGAGRPAQVECLKTRLGQRDEGGRRRPEPIPGSNFTLAADTIVSALGEQVEISFLPGAVKYSGGVIDVDDYGRTSLAGVYAAGDATSANRSVVEAIASGKRAAVGVDLFFRQVGEEGAENCRKGRAGAVSMSRYLANDVAPIEESIVSFKDLNMDHFEHASQQRPAMLSAKAGLQGFVETTSGLSLEQAIAEAERCFQCGSCIVCEICYISCPDTAISFEDERPAFNNGADICKSCGICIHECPRSAISWKGVTT